MKGVIEINIRKHNSDIEKVKVHCSQLSFKIDKITLHTQLVLHEYDEIRNLIHKSYELR